MHLKPVRLLLGARFGVDALNVLLGVGIGSFPHNVVWNFFRLTNERKGNFSVMQTRAAQNLRFFNAPQSEAARGDSRRLLFLHRPSAGGGHNKDAAPRAAT